MSDDLTRLERLTVDVDTRLTAVWLMVWRAWGGEEPDEERTRDLVGSLIRASYGLGYSDALREERQGRRGELARANGYKED